MGMGVGIAMRITGQAGMEFPSWRAPFSHLGESLHFIRKGGEVGCTDTCSSSNYDLVESRVLLFPLPKGDKALSLLHHCAPGIKCYTTRFVQNTCQDCCPKLVDCLHIGKVQGAETQRQDKRIVSHP